MDFRRGVPNAKVVEKEKGKREEWLVVSESEPARGDYAGPMITKMKNSNRYRALRRPEFP